MIVKTGGIDSDLFCGFFLRMIGTWLIGYFLVGHIGAWALLSMPVGFLWAVYWVERTVNCDIPRMPKGPKL